MQSIQIFKPGRHKAMDGRALEFSESDLQASADAYDPALHEAPLVVGHPRSDHPAYGWVRGLSYGEGLEATPDQVDPAFAEMVSAGRFKKVSASFYPPNAKSNPVPGVYYLRHVGFLGAQPPAVKGLKAVEFADADDDVVTLEFGEVEGGLLKDILRRLREYLIAERGTDTADQVVPSYAVEEIQRDDPTSPDPMYSEPEPQEVSAVDKAELERRERALADREAKINEQEAQFSEREQQLQEDAAKRRREAHAARVDQAVEAGRLLPRERDGVLAFLEAQDAEAVVEFGEGDDATQADPREWFLEFLDRQPVAVDYAERGGRRDGENAPAASVDVPDGYEVDPQSAALHRKALEYMEAHQVDIVTAVNAVQREEA
ncbi:peptidase [Thioalkalivibrio sp. ALMg9]|uniref:peptidase n=1 Tax=Thioalkalivibrio sp. ALMg9 TaxID=1266912 RepID=UPI0005704B55|nr:peptidase [Thioalkalivibrio sp. ALMg9]